MIFETNPIEIKKGWGREVIISGEQYCGKLLQFNENSCSSNHFHVKKIETFLCYEGKGRIEGINPVTAEKFTIKLAPGAVVHITPGSTHQVFADTKMTLIEFSSKDEETDSYRIGKGDSQK